MLSPQVCHVGGGGDRHRDVGMPDQPLQEELRPGRRAELGGPLGHRAAPHTAEETRAAERTVDERGHALVAGDGDQLVLGAAVVDRVVELDEVPVRGPEDADELLVLELPRGRDAVVPNPTFLLELPEQAQLGFPVAQVVDLHEVEIAGREALFGLSHLSQALTAAPDAAHLCGQEHVVRVPDVADDLTQHDLRAPVCGGRVDERAPELGELPDDVGQGGSLSAGACRTEERAGGAEPDDRDPLARDGNRLGEDLLGSREERGLGDEPATQEQSCARRCSHLQGIPSGEGHASAASVHCGRPSRLLSVLPGIPSRDR